MQSYLRQCHPKQRKQQQQQVTVQQKMINRNSEMPRNFKFHEKSIRNFVQGSSFLNSTSTMKENRQANNNQGMLAQTMGTFDSKPKGFDFYSKKNLLLKACNAEDIQYVRKNPVVYEQEIVIPHQLVSNKNIKSSSPTTHEVKAKTASHFYRPEKKEDEGKMSRQAEMNQFLFNYRKNQEQKKNKKLKFLQEVEERIKNIEKEATNLEVEKQKQFEEINGMLEIHSEATQFAKKAEMVGKLNTALYELQGEGKRLPSPKKITEDMGMLEINAAIEEHREYNDALLNQIERVSRSKSKERAIRQESRPQNFQKTGLKKGGEGPPQTSLSRTIKRPNLPVPPKPTSSKKLTSTWKGKS